MFRHLHATEMYKVKCGYTPKIFNDLFHQREISLHNLRKHPEFRVPLSRTVYHGSESISKIWDILPASFKEAISLNNFEKLIKKWVPLACPCRLCKKCIPRLGFDEGLP